MSRLRTSPAVSRFSVVADPQMATLALVKGLKSGQAQSAQLGAPGRVGWHELLAADWENRRSHSTARCSAGERPRAILA